MNEYNAHGGEDTEALLIPPNCWMFLDYDVIQDLQSLSTLLGSPGGSVEQTGLYVDPLNAANWLKISANADYQALLHEGLQFTGVAELISHYLAEYQQVDSLDIIALGPGDGTKEVELSQHLLRQFNAMRLILLDVSYPLLRLALKKAIVSMHSEPNVNLIGALGNFHHLQKYIYFMSPPASKRRRLVTLLGHTYTNLHNETAFIRNGLAGLAPGDMLLFDFTLTAAPAERPEEVSQREPRLTGSGFSAVDRCYEKFFLGTLQRYCHRFEEAAFYARLDYTSVIPGSYSIERCARIKATGYPEREFSLMIHKRYDLNKLIDVMRMEGFGPINGWPFGKNKERMLYLFEKLPPARR